MRLRLVLVLMVGTWALGPEAGSGGTASASMHEVKPPGPVQLHEVPEATRKTIIREVKPGYLTALTRQDRNGQPVYEARFMKDREQRMIVVDERGQVVPPAAAPTAQAQPPAAPSVASMPITQRSAVQLDKVPEPVRRVILREVEPGYLTALERQQRGDRVSYEARFVRDRTARILLIDDRGEVLASTTQAGQAPAPANAAGQAPGTEVPVALDQTPEAVRRTIQQEVGPGQIIELERELTRHGQVIYEADFIRDGLEVEIDVDERGTVIKRETGREAR